MSLTDDDKTRNQVALTGSWVRIPPLPPLKKPYIQFVCRAFSFSGFYARYKSNNFFVLPLYGPDGLSVCGGVLFNQLALHPAALLFTNEKHRRHPLVREVCSGFFLHHFYTNSAKAYD